MRLLWRTTCVFARSRSTLQPAQRDHFPSACFRTRVGPHRSRTETDRQTDRQSGRQADRQTDRQSGRQTDRQIDRQTPEPEDAGLARTRHFLRSPSSFFVRPTLLHDQEDALSLLLAASSPIDGRSSCVDSRGRDMRKVSA